MKKNTNTMKTLMVGGILASGLMLGACNIPSLGNGNSGSGQNTGNEGKDKDSIYYSDLSDDDFELIDYVNTHSDYVFTLLGEMKNGSIMQDVGNLYGESSDDLLVDSYGVYLGEFDKVITTQINISDESDYNILGVHYGDTYKVAKEILENEGFECVKDTNYGKSFTYTSYEKGCVNIFVSSQISDGVALEDQEVTSITVSIPIEDLERESQNQTGGLFVTASDSNSNNPVKFSPKAGDEVYNGFSSTITVKSVTDDEIEFELTGCLVEANSNGSVNLNKDPLTKLTLKKGDKIKLASQTMDAGVKITLEYK